jgi:hypothetical protein
VAKARQLQCMAGVRKLARADGKASGLGDNALRRPAGNSFADGGGFGYTRTCQRNYATRFIPKVAVDGGARCKNSHSICRGLGSRMLQLPSGGTGLFHLGAHCVEIIGGRDHGKKHYQRAGEKQEWTEAPKCLAVRAIGRLAHPKPDGRYRKCQPKNIEQQFHYCKL